MPLLSQSIKSYTTGLFPPDDERGATVDDGFF
jgi:hypothetical protein